VDHFAWGYVVRLDVDMKSTFYAASIWSFKWRVDMWIEKISAYMANNRYIKPQRGADSAIIKEAERKLKVSFPAELKSLLLEINGDNYLLFSVEQIVENNLDSRKVLGEVYDGLDRLLFIAGNGCGDYYSYQIIDGEVISSQIVRWDHEVNSTVSVACNLTEMIEKYYAGQI